VINKLGHILHRLATIHPLHKTTDDDGRQLCKTPTAGLHHCCSASIDKRTDGQDP